MSAPHHLCMRSSDQLLNSTKGSVQRMVYFDFLQGEQLCILLLPLLHNDLLGEQGAESIHVKFNSLGRAYTAIRVKRLKCILKEHLLSIAPDMVAAIPRPPKKRMKSFDGT